MIIYGRDTENRTVAVRVVGCYSYCFVKLPYKPVNVEKTADDLMDDIKDIIQSRNRRGRSYQDPIRIEPYDGMFLRSCEKAFFYKIVMPSERSKAIFNNAYGSSPFAGSKRLKRSGFVCSDISFHEVKRQMGVLFQVTTDREISLSDWIDVKETSNWPPMYNRYFNREKHHSNVDVNITCLPRDLCKSERDSTLNIDPSILSFDIECYSSRKCDVMPDPHIIRDRITSISFRYGPYSKSAYEWKGITLSLGDSPNINSDYDVISFMDERDLVLEFGRLIKKINPDIITGYNIVGFDWEYIYGRCKLLNILDEFMSFGRYRYPRSGKNCYLREIQWQSSAYGDQKNKFIAAIGILQLDVLKEVRITLGVGLPTYTLNAVSEHFLGESKKDLPIPELHRILSWKEDYLLLRDSTPFPELKKHLLGMFDEYEVVGSLIDMVRRIRCSANSKMLYAAMLHGTILANDYCDTDALLPALLMQRCSIIEGVQELSRARRVPMDFHAFRGQGIKSLALMYPYFRHGMYVLNAKEETLVEDEGKYTGATVLGATKGHHKEVAILDFSSLYPSVMIDKNICLTTLRRKGVEHDPSNDGPLEQVEGLVRVPTSETHIGCGCPGAEEKKEGEETRCKVQYHEFVDQGERIGLFPKVLRSLLASRKEVRAGMVPIKDTLISETDPEARRLIKSRLNILDRRQLAIKVACNSLYGIMGAKTSPFHERAVAESVTAAGRTYLKRACDYIYDRYPGIDVVYGDSVTGDTPLVLRDGERVFVRTIDQLVSEGDWRLSIDSKEYGEVPLEVWSDRGFTPIRHVIRHKTRKTLYRVTTHSGSVIVTEDHSLLDESASPITPGKLSIGNKLLVRSHPELTGSRTIPDAWELGFSCGVDESNKIPDRIFGACLESRQKFFEGYCASSCDKGHSRKSFCIKGQIESAGLCLLASSLGYKASVNVRSDKRDIYQVTLAEGSQQIDPARVKKIEEWGSCDTHVYDLETANHHFAAGVGQLVVHNTDSTLIKFNSPEYLARPRSELVGVAKEIAAGISDDFGGIMTLNFEHYFSSFIQITKKNYIADIWEALTKEELEYFHLFTLTHTKEHMNNDYWKRMASDRLFVKLKTLLREYLGWLQITRDLIYDPEEREQRAEDELETYLRGDRVSGLYDLIKDALAHFKDGFIVYRMWKGVMAKKRGYCKIARDLYRNLVEFKMADTGLPNFKVERIIPDLLAMAIRGILIPGIFSFEDFIISKPLKDPDSFDSTNSLGYLLATRLTREERMLPTPSRITLLYVNRDAKNLTAEEKEIFTGPTGPYKGFYAEEGTYYRYNKDRLGLTPNQELYLEFITSGSISNLVNVVCGNDRVRVFDARKDTATLLESLESEYPRRMESIRDVFSQLFPPGYDKTPSQRKNGSIGALEVGTKRLIDVRNHYGSLVLSESDRWFKPAGIPLFKQKRAEIKRTCELYMDIDNPDLVEEICEVSNEIRTRYVLDGSGIKNSRAGIETIDGRMYKTRNAALVPNLQSVALNRQRLLESIKSDHTDPVVSHLFQTT